MSSPIKRSARHAFYELLKAAALGLLSIVLVIVINNFLNGRPIFSLSILEGVWESMQANFTTQRGIISTGVSGALVVLIAFLYFLKKYFNTGSLPPQWGVVVTLIGGVVLYLLFPGVTGAPHKLADIQLLQANTIKLTSGAVLLLIAGIYFAYTQVVRGN